FAAYDRDATVERVAQVVPRDILLTHLRDVSPSAVLDDTLLDRAPGAVAAAMSPRRCSPRCTRS
ncbi:hypothetical protein NJ76_30165, partial [Rhodococcus sp. IITR03]